jgi:hypothetical protein
VADGGLDAHLHGHGDGDGDGGVLRVSECVAECCLIRGEVQAVGESDRGLGPCGRCVFIRGSPEEDRHACQAALILFWSLRDPEPRAAFRGC